VGGERPAAWAKYLHRFGYYPSIITRNWNHGQIELTDALADNSLKHEVFDTHEVFRLPYNRTLRDKLNDYSDQGMARVLRKALSFYELVLNNFALRSIPYSNFYDFAKSLIDTSPGKYHLLIATGRPFQLFSIAHRLHQSTNIKWLADYRDEWNTFQNTTQSSVLWQLVSRLERRSEKQWCSSCAAILSVSDHWQTNIANLVQKPGFVVMNGYASDDSPPIQQAINNRKMEISYIGTLYAIQEIEIFIAAIKTIIPLYSDKISLKVNFVGIEVMPGQRERVERLTKGMNNVFKIYNRVNKEELSAFFAQSDLLLATGFSGIKGWYPVKIFEYCKTGIPILLCPSDNDVMQQMLTELNAGYSAQTENECVEIIASFIRGKLNHTPLISQINKQALTRYSRENQTKILADLLDKL